MEEKIFYNISEVSEKVDLPKYVIRFWEKEFSEINPERRQNRRYYRDSDIDIILKIKELLYKKGFTIKGAQKALRDNKKEQTGKVFSNFKVDEENKTLEPIQENKILKKFNFEQEIIKNPDIDIHEILNRLKKIEDILSE